MLPRFGTHALSVETRDGYTVAEIEAAGGIALGIEVDVRDQEAVGAMVARVVQEWGGVDVLVANEGRVGATRHLTVRSRPPLRPRAATNIADRVGAAGHALNALTRPVEPLATTRCSVCRGNERGRARPFVRRWPKVAGARLPPSPPLIYRLSNEVLLPERAGGRDRFVAG